MEFKLPALKRSWPTLFRAMDFSLVFSAVMLLALIADSICRLHPAGKGIIPNQIFTDGGESLIIFASICANLSLYFLMWKVAFAEYAEDIEEMSYHWIAIPLKVVGWVVGTVAAAILGAVGIELLTGFSFQIVFMMLTNGIMGYLDVVLGAIVCINAIFAIYKDDSHLAARARIMKHWKDRKLPAGLSLRQRLGLLFEKRKRIAEKRKKGQIQVPVTSSDFQLRKLDEDGSLPVAAQELLDQKKQGK